MGRTQCRHRGGIGKRRTGGTTYTACLSASNTASCVRSRVVHPEARAERNTIRAGPECGGVPEDIPAIRVIPVADEIVGGVGDQPRLGGLNVNNRIEFPAFQ